MFKGMKSQGINRLLTRFVGEVAYRAAARPRGTLLAGLFLTIAAFSYACVSLEFRTSRLDLLSERAAYNQRWLAYLGRFGNEDDAVVVVSHSQPSRVAEVVSSIGRQLQADGHLSGVIYRKSFGSVSRKAMQLMPPEELGKLNHLLQSCLQVLDQQQSSHLVSQVAHWSEQLNEGLAWAQNGLGRLNRSFPEEGPLLLEDKGRLGVCLVRLPHVDDSRDARDLIERLQNHLNRTRLQFADTDIWLTGMPVLEWDESQSSQRDMRTATIVSLVGVAVVFAFGFGSWRIPCAAVIALAIGLIWTLGLAALLIGHLNLFSVAFGAIIAGLGIDYSIHLIARLNSERSSGSLPERLSRAMAHCGKGIVTGALTTAAAFAVSVMTPFQGMAELGVICALGTMACMVVSIWLLPALIAWQATLGTHAKDVDTSNTVDIHVSSSHLSNWLTTVNKWTFDHKASLLAGVAIITMVAGLQSRRMRYDHNLLNLQDDDVPSVIAERELTGRSGQSAWYAISMAASPEKTLALRKRLTQLPSVDRVEDIGSVIATARMNRNASPLVEVCRDRALQILHRIAQSQAYPARTENESQLISSSNDSPNSVVPAVHRPSNTFTPQFASQMQLLSESILKMSDSAPLTAEDFPAAVGQRMVSSDGNTFLLRIFARENLWQRENLQRFVKEIETVDPYATGHPIQTWYASGELERSYYQAGIYAVLAVAALLMIDLGSVRMVGLAMIPVCLSLLQLCGLLVMAKISFNAANMIVLPLILGIGIDYGVHVMHDFHARSNATFRLSMPTTLAVLMTGLTTIVGFGSMSLAHHRGLQSLGIVLSLGVALCMLNSWFTLPALLSFFSAREGLLSPVAASTISHATLEAAQPHCEPENQPTRLEEQKSMLLRDIPIVMSLPSYPDTR